MQDAEMEAIRRCLRWVAEEAVQDGGLVRRRVLVLGDSIGVLQDIEAVWRMGTAEAFRLRNRRGMMEDIIRLRRDLGAVVFQWVRGHGGVHCNAHADMIAKACLDEGVEDSVGEQRRRQRCGTRCDRRQGGAGQGCQRTGGRCACSRRGCNGG